MYDSPLSTISAHFAHLEDPRTGPAVRHQFMDMLVITICAVICGADTWVDVESFGQAKQPWLQEFLELPNGIPSHDTFGRLFALLDVEQFARSFDSWTRAIHAVTQGQVIAIDGKTVRRSHDSHSGKRALHLVSAWATENQISLGQVQTEEKSNEITAIPELLRLLDVSGCIVTIDAMGCQREIAHQIVQQQADYILAVKDNQPKLHERVQHLFAYAQAHKFRHVPHTYHGTSCKDHGREEKRQCWAIGVEEWRYCLDGEGRWPQLQSVVMIRSERRIGEHLSRETRYYITSLPPEAKRLLSAIRSHWQIENSLHWVLDIAFREDESRLRKGWGQTNMSVLRKLALNLLKQDTHTKGGIKAKRLRAGWDRQYLLSLLNQ